MFEARDLEYEVMGNCGCLGSVTMAWEHIKPDAFERRICTQQKIPVQNGKRVHCKWGYGPTWHPISPSHITAIANQFHVWEFCYFGSEFMQMGHLCWCHMAEKYQIWTENQKKHSNWEVHSSVEAHSWIVGKRDLVSKWFDLTKWTASRCVSLMEEFLQGWRKS